VAAPQPSPIAFNFMLECGLARPAWDDHVAGVTGLELRYPVASYALEIVATASPSMMHERERSRASASTTWAKRGDHSARETSTGYGWPRRVRPARRSPERAFGPA
jgi:hypothetical protein